MVKHQDELDQYNEHCQECYDELFATSSQQAAKQPIASADPDFTTFTILLQQQAQTIKLLQEKIKTLEQQVSIIPTLQQQIEKFEKLHQDIENLYVQFRSEEDTQLSTLASLNF